MAPAPQAPPPAADTFDFERNDRLDTERVPLEGRPGAQPAPGLPATPQASAEVADPAGGPVQVWDPRVPRPGSTFGVRVLRTLLDVQPPQALIVLPDGGMEVVQAGTMLPDQALIVLAIGAALTEIATIEPQGGRAVIEIEQLSALSPADPAR